MADGLTENARKASRTVVTPNAVMQIRADAPLVVATQPPAYPSLPFTSSQSNDSLDPVDKSALGQKLKTELQQSRISFLGEKDTLGAHLLFTQEPILEAARQAGKKHLLLELPYYFQGIADQLAIGQITPKEYVRDYIALVEKHTAVPADLPKDYGRIWGEETANIIVRAHAAGIKVGFVDPYMNTADKTNPHTGCIADGPWQQQYDKEKARLIKDFNRSRNVDGTEITSLDLPKAVQYALDRPSQYAELFRLRETFHTSQRQRVSGSNERMAQLISRQTQGEPSVGLFGLSHLEGVDSVPAHLATIGQSSRVTGLLLDYKEAQNYYSAEASANSRWFNGDDFSNAPDSVLLLNGRNKKPEYYAIPPKWIEWAKEATAEGHYANPNPIRVMPQLPAGVDVSAADSAFSQSLACTPRSGETSKLHR